MRIDANSQTPYVTRPQVQPTPSRPAPASTQGQDQTEFTAADSLARRLDSAPDVRADRLERARALVADMQYPPTSVLRQVAKALTRTGELE